MTNRCTSVASLQGSLKGLQHQVIIYFANWWTKGKKVDKLTTFNKAHSPAQLKFMKKNNDAKFA